MKNIRERGAALLMAMLTVALVATFAAAALWQQWRSIEVESAERARVQSEWILTGALDWARLLLREDHMGQGINGPDHLGEPWAVPLQEARLSSFLAADRNATTMESGPEVFDAFLSGQIVDLQSMLNVNNLTVKTQGADDDRRAFERLFDLLGLPQSELERMAENLRFAGDTSSDNQSAPLAPLQPQRVEQLVWLGLSPQTVAALQPYVTLLPTHTQVNINTAPAEVIYAAAPGIDMAEAQSIVTLRERAPFRQISDAYGLLAGGAAAMPAGRLTTTATAFFEVRARLRLDQLIVEERSLVQRSGIDVRVLHRERGAVDPAAISQAAAKR